VEPEMMESECSEVPDAMTKDFWEKARLVMPDIPKEALDAALEAFSTASGYPIPAAVATGSRLETGMEAALKAAAPYITQGYYEECTKLRPVIETLSKENTRLKTIIDQQQRDARTGIRSW